MKIKVKNSIHSSYLFLLFIGCTTVVFSQEISPEQLQREARKEVRDGNKLYNELKFDEAEAAYKRALAKTPNYPTASYNLGNSVYQQNRNKEAVGQFEIAAKTAKDKFSLAESFHNMGNATMKEKQYAQAVEAYKNALRNNSKDDETRYNLALAQELLKKEQDKNKDDKKDNKDDKNKDQKDKEGGDKDKKDDKKDNENKGKDKKDDHGNQKKEDQKQDQKEKKQQRPSELSPEQIAQLLEAMNNEENKTQQKINAKQAKGKKIKQEKDW
ncbi:tetratricopeptide repeat protein [Lutibacter sp.]|uniref:tetratricopeptide repeat protein n=1 Tax=Lutibacter sp. TaxID=1925666 RepID=UPI0027345192|nr:tetratricopeptide repeat protein [Lutibacter sp.]MDP3314126.1 tetratricopeptide repeat protein [Lutibacter sp.]